MSDDLFRVAIQAIVEGFDKANSELEKLNKNLEQTEKSGKRSQRGSEAAAKSTKKLTDETTKTVSAQQRARQQFLATANSIAVLDGPLGGVASRFSAFGVLIGRIGIPLAGLAIGFSAFTFAAQRAIREFADWEVQLRTVENRLNAMGNQVAFTSDQIVQMSNRLAGLTLMDEREVISAAGQLLTFRNITTEVFEDVLKSAADLAASGFGTLESETIKLAKALEDPRQSLTSLSRAGIVFTRQQRNMIISLADMGREAEAMEIILQNVNKQVGGAAEAQARDTLAGSFDTIGQSVRQLTRDFGEMLADNGVRQVFEVLAGALEPYSRGNIPLEDRVNNLRNELRIIQGQAKDTSSDLNKLGRSFAMVAETIGRGLIGGAAGISRMEVRTPQSIQEELRAAEAMLRLQERRNALKQTENALDRRQESLTNLQAQIDLQRESIGLSEDEIRVRRMLAQEGMGEGAIQKMREEIQAYRSELLSLGLSYSVVNAMVAEKEESLKGALSVGQELRDVLQDQRTARRIQQIADSSKQTNAILSRQVEILEEARAAGNDALTVTEARRQAELETQIQTIRTEKAIVAAAGATALLAMNFAEAAKAAAEVARLALIIENLEDNADLTLRLGDLGRTGRGGGGGGGGGTDPFQKEMDALNNFLEEAERARLTDFERFQLDFEERQNVLEMALEKQLITKQEFAEKEKQLEMAKNAEIANAQQRHMETLSQMQQQTASSFIGLLGQMGQKSKAFAVAAVALSAAQRVSEIQASTAASIMRAYAELGPIAGAPVAARMAAIGKVQMAIAAASGVLGAAGAARGGSGGGRSAGGARTAAAPREAREAAPQRVLIQGLDPNAFYTGEQLQSLFEAFYEENSNRGKIFVVSQ